MNDLESVMFKFSDEYARGGDIEDGCHIGVYDKENDVIVTADDEYFNLQDDPYMMVASLESVYVGDALLAQWKMLSDGVIKQIKINRQKLALQSLKDLDSVRFRGSNEAAAGNMKMNDEDTKNATNALIKDMKEYNKMISKTNKPTLVEALNETKSSKPDREKFNASMKNAMNKFKSENGGCITSKESFEELRDATVQMKNIANELFKRYSREIIQEDLRLGHLCEYLDNYTFAYIEESADILMFESDYDQPIGIDSRFLYDQRMWEDKIAEIARYKQYQELQQEFGIITATAQ